MFLPNVDLKQMVMAAVWNVDYHLRAVKRFNQQPGMATLWEDDATVEASRKPHLQSDVNRFHAHLRAFFWELVAAFETMKVWATEIHGRNSTQLAELEKVEQELWFVDMSNYRNFAHRSFLVNQGLFQVESRKLIFRSLIQARKGGPQRMIPDGLVEFRDELHKLFVRVLSLPANAMPSVQTSAS